jgi:putative zinc finger/helix-turn-helix YgiT family protein
MNCLRCNNERFIEKPDAVIEQEFRGELLKVHAPAMACSKCGWVTVGLRQLDTLRRRTADAYREQHGLLTSAQIRAFRLLLKMSQREFAVFLGVGEASVKRWETWLAQEKSSDRLIRMRCEKECGERLAHERAPAAWIACDHQAAEAADGTTVQESPSTKDLNPPRWRLQADLPQAEHDPQSEASYDTSDPDFSHAA